MNDTEQWEELLSNERQMNKEKAKLFLALGVPFYIFCILSFFMDIS